MENDEVILKLLILGDMSVGKTTLLLKYVDNYTPDIYISTFGVDYKIKNIVYNNIKITLQIWDTAGEERYRVITKSFVKGADGVIYMYDITQKDSFINIKKWIEETEAQSLNAQKIIVGNKIDLEENREVTEEMKEKLKKELNVDIIEISAKQGINIDQAFDKLVKKILGDMKKEEIFAIFSRNANASFSNFSVKEKKKCC